jgi:hypothetical protein
MLRKEMTMPNHVRNALTIYGPARDVATFVMLSQQPRPRTGDQPRYVDGQQVNPNYTEEPREQSPFDFYGVVPLPAHYSVVPYDSNTGVCGYDLEHTTWGQKWGPYDINPAEDIQIAEHAATFHFTTAWGPPRQYYVSASARFPQCLLAVSWNGEGPSFGRARYQAGQAIETIEGDYEELPPYTDEDEGAAQDAASAHYLTTHAVWVDALIAQQETR